MTKIRPAHVACNTADHNLVAVRRGQHPEPALAPATQAETRRTIAMRKRTRRRTFTAGLLALVTTGWSGGLYVDAQQPPSSSIGIPSAQSCIHHGNHTSGRLSGDSSLPDQGRGYYHFLGTNGRDMDDWACSHWLIARIATVGQQWNRNPRIGIGDLSLRGGGPFTPHKSHQNGLDVDVRYVGVNEGPINFNVSRIRYDQNRTQELIDIFCETGALAIYVDQRANLSSPCIIEQSGHHHHFHVRYPAP